MNPDHDEKDIAPLMASLAKKREQIILFGAGACGGYVLRHLRARGVEPAAVVDNRPEKWGTSVSRGTCMDGIEGVGIMSPEAALQRFRSATWVACAISRPAAVEIRAQLKAMGVKTKPLWECLPVCHGLPPRSVQGAIAGILDDEESLLEWCDQYKFRENPDYARQRSPSDVNDIYFPDFIQHHDDDHFVDCGAADGDTIRSFRLRWLSYRAITAIEPDAENFHKLEATTEGDPSITLHRRAVSDGDGWVNFESNGDYSSHLAREGRDLVRVSKLDGMGLDRPTYMKFDIEGSELEALWGARRIMKEHMPVIAVCAYHTSDHLWQIPLLIHAIQPDYRLYLRRYAEGAFELVWYAVPPERVK